MAYDYNLESDKADNQAAYWAGLLKNSADSNKETKAARKAQDAYNQKKLELDQQGLALQSDQIAKQYAMDQAKLEWDKESFKEQFGHQVDQDNIDNAFREKQSALDETWRVAEQTGFRDGVPTLATMQFNEQTRQYNQTFGENQRQFNVSTVLNAPRGPADWAAYEKKMRGLQGTGSMPGAVGSMFDPNAQVASFSNGGQATGPVLSNTDLAFAATGLGSQQGLQGTPWQGAFGSQPSSTSGAAASPSFTTNSENPYGETNPTASAAGNALGVDTTQQQADRPTQQSDGSMDMSLPSIQKFRKYAPTEQDMGLGYLAENGGPTEDDAKYLMSRQSPNYKQSAAARFAGV